MPSNPYATNSVDISNKCMHTQRKNKSTKIVGTNIAKDPERILIEGHWVDCEKRQHNTNQYLCLCYLLHVHI